MALLYAIVGNMDRARFMLDGGAPYLQLRFKEVPLAPHLSEIKAWAARYPHTRVIINDDLNMAEQAGVWGVHLGQEDLQRSSRQAVLDTPLKVGISTHSDAEIEIALEYGAHHLGFGPLFTTGTKAVGHPPQGVDRLREVVARLKQPVVAIGGINDTNLAAVATTGVAMVAMIAYLDSLTTPQALADLMKRLA